MLAPKVGQLLRKISITDTAKEHGYRALRALRSFVSAFKISYGEISMSIEPEPGIADSGNLENDLSDLFVRIGEAAKAVNTAWTLLIDRLTPKEREYVIAMAKLGSGHYKSSDVADALGEKLQTLGPRRAKIINKGMIYSPSHGDIGFTVPMFNEYLMRHFSS